MPKTYPTMSTNVWQVLSPSSQIEAFNKDSLLAIREGGQWVVRLNTIQSHWVKMDETRAEVADSWRLILQLQHSLITKNDQNRQGQFFHRYQIQFPNLFRWISFSWVWEYSFFFFCQEKYSISMLLLLSRFSRVQLCVTPWTAPHSLGKRTGVDCHALLQGLFLTQGAKQGLLHCRWMRNQGSPSVSMRCCVMLYG